MIYFDTTKAARSGHHSGIQRVGARLRAELGALSGDGLRAVRWDGRARRWQTADGAAVAPGPEDWLFTPELFSEGSAPASARGSPRPAAARPSSTTMRSR